MKQYEMKEFSFPGVPPVASQVRVDIKGVFTCNSEETVVEGFYAGNGVYKIRFYPDKPGLYHWRVTGAVSGAGEEECTPASAENDHGRVETQGTHFRYEDGTPYYPFGTTVYAMLHQPEELREATMATLAKMPFNKIRFCLFPKSFDYNQNEPELFPFEQEEGKWKPDVPCFAFWDRLDDYVDRLGKMGIEADMILFHPYDRWGFAGLSKEECLTYLDYAVRRLAAYPNVWWSLANEYDQLFRFGQDWWFEFARFINAKEAWKHCLSNHNFIKRWNFADAAVSHCCIQGGRVKDVAKLREAYRKPVIFDECGYEGDIPYSWGNLSAFELVSRFWTACTLGGYCSHGETYLDEEDILWWSKGGRIYGESPDRIGFLKEILYSLPGPLESVPSAFEAFLQEPERQILEEKAQTDPFTEMLLHLPGESLVELAENAREIKGHCGEEAYLFYNERQCKRRDVIRLPESGTYRVEIIDVWEMTKKTFAVGVKGAVELELPGKEGIAVLAVRQ